MATRRNLAVVLALLLCAACAVLPGRRGSGGQTVGLTSKPVAAKEPHTSLIAADGTRCLVSEQKYRDTEIGSRVLCFWSVTAP